MRKVKNRSKLLPIAIIVLIYAAVVVVSGIMNANAAGDIFTIKNVEAVEKSETIEIKSLSFENSTINSDVVFHNVGEFVKYKITIQNNADKDYKIKAVTDNNQNGCVTYEYLGWSDTEIKANSTSDFFVTAKYSKEVENVANRLQNMDVKIDVQLEDEYGNLVNKSIKSNTKTGDNVVIYSSLFAISTIAVFGVVVIKRKGKNSKKLFSVLILIALTTPVVSKAAESLLAFNFKCTVALEDKIVITYVDDLTGKTDSVVAKYGESVIVADAPKEDADDFVAWVDESGKAVSGSFVATDDITLHARRMSDEDYERAGFVFALEEDDTYSLVEYTGDAVNVRVPAKYKGKSVTSIDNGAFQETDIENIILPESIKTIGDAAFGQCIELKSIKLPDSVISIGTGSFLKCESLESVTLSKNLENIGMIAFEECTSLSSIVIPDSVTSIGWHSFFRSGLSSCTIGKGVKKIEVGAFRECEQLNSIIIPDNVETLENSVFLYCSNLRNLSIGKGLSNIGDMVCVHCKNLESISVDNENQTFYVANNCVLTKNDNVLCIAGKNSSIPSNTTKIREYAFCGSNIQNITMPDSLTTIERGAFSENNDLRSVSFGKNVSSIDEAQFADCDNLESLTVDPENSVYYSQDNCIITKADKKLITGCKTGVLPDDITSIEASAFSYCNKLKSVKIPVTVTSIGDEAFFRCKELEEIIYAGTQEQWDNIPKGSIWLSSYYGTMVYTDSTDFTYTLLGNGTYEVTGYIGSDDVIIIPIEHDGQPVTSIGENAFSGVDRIIIPRTITNISSKAFSGDHSLYIRYRGTKAEWDNIEKASDWNNNSAYLCNVTCSDTNVSSIE